MILPPRSDTQEPDILRVTTRYAGIIKMFALLENVGGGGGGELQVNGPGGT